MQGNTLLPAAEVDALLAGYAGPARGFADVRRAVEALQSRYRQRGWGVVQVQLPEQELAGGVVRLQVIEPRLGRLRVEGQQFFTEANVRAALPGLREGATPRLDDVSASLRVANTSPARQLTLALQGGDTPGTVDAVVRVADEKPWRIGLTADNTGTRESGRTRLGLLAQHANLWGLDHVGSLQYSTTAEEPSKVSVWAAGYHVPLYALGDSLDFFASHSNVDSGVVTAGVLALQVSGQGTVLGARYNHVLAPRGDLTSTLIAGFDWRAYKNDISVEGFQLGDEVRLHPLSLTWSGQLALPSAVLAVQLTGVQNIPGGARGREADLARQRLGAQGDYRLLRYGASFTQQFQGDWQLRAQFNGQATREALVPGEQFGAGGAASVRGFREREIAGDQGRFASLELQSPNLCPMAGTLALQCRALAFADGANVSRNGALPGEERRTGIASAGLGLRVAVGRHASLAVDWARVIDGGGTRQPGDHRVHLALSISY